MTTTYDPFHPRYFDDTDLRKELTRVYDLCHGCRLCFKFCDSFPTLFEAIDRHDDQDAAKLTRAEQDQVVDECFNCKLCYVNCPYVPGQSEWNLYFPRLMLRAKQVRHRDGAKSVRQQITDQALGRTDLSGRLGSLAAPVANATLGRPGSAVRNLVEKTVGIASTRVLPPYARQRFSTWFAKRGRGSLGRTRQGRVAVFPTCLVEYQDSAIGQDLVKVYERNGIECSLPEGQRCCGAPFLHQGDVDRFRNEAATNVSVLAGAIRAAAAEGDDLAVVVPQPTCGYTLKHDYVDYLGGADARLVAEHTYDAAEYLMKVHATPGSSLDTTFEGDAPEAVTYHAPCHLRAQNIGLKSRDLMKLTGARVSVVAECSAVDGTWGLRAEHLHQSRRIAQKMATAIDEAGSDTVAGDCRLAATAIVQETGHVASHPLQVVARAYGIPPEPHATSR